MWNSSEIVLQGTKIRFHRTGGDGPAVVLSHGITDNGLCWSGLAQALEAEYDVIMYDARAHGLSDAPELAYSFEDLAADLAGLIQGLELVQPILIGHSMGASTTAATAADYPELVGCAILEDPPWRAEVFGQSIEERAERAEEWRTGALQRQSIPREELLETCRKENPHWSEVEYDPWVDSKLQVRPEAFNLLTSAHTPWQDVAARIQCPILLITGDPSKGAIVTPETAAEASGVWRNGKVVHVEDVGHCIRREQPDRYLAAIREFLAGL